MNVTVPGVFAASLLGSLHCAGMCGPIVAAYAGMPGAQAPWRDRAKAHAVYSAGRLVAYAALGAAGGAFGAALDRAGAWAGIASAAAIVSGVLIALFGFVSFLGSRSRGVPRLGAPSFLKRGLVGLMRAAGGGSPSWRIAVLGLGTALLPCGWLYAFVVVAAGTGSAVRGAAVMALFWSGTLPAMTAFGEAVRFVAGPLRRHVPAACALVLVILGLWTVWERAGQSWLLARAGPASPACHAKR